MSQDPQQIEILTSLFFCLSPFVDFQRLTTHTSFPYSPLKFLTSSEHLSQWDPQSHDLWPVYESPDLELGVHQLGQIVAGEGVMAT